MRRTRRLALILAAGLLAAGCAGVQPWEHDVLARRSMQLNTHPNIAAADDHIYFSKEGSSGGQEAETEGQGEPPSSSH